MTSAGRPDWVKCKVMWVQHAPVPRPSVSSDTKLLLTPQPSACHYIMSKSALCGKVSNQASLWTGHNSCSTYRMIFAYMPTDCWRFSPICFVNLFIIKLRLHDIPTIIFLTFISRQTKNFSESTSFGQNWPTKECWGKFSPLCHHSVCCTLSHPFLDRWSHSLPAGEIDCQCDFSYWKFCTGRSCMAGTSVLRRTLCSPLRRLCSPKQISFWKIFKGGLWSKGAKTFEKIHLFWSAQPSLDGHLQSQKDFSPDVPSGILVYHLS